MANAKKPEFPQNDHLKSPDPAQCKGYLKALSTRPEGVLVSKMAGREDKMNAMNQDYLVAAGLCVFGIVTNEEGKDEERFFATAKGLEAHASGELPEAPTMLPHRRAWPKISGPPVGLPTPAA